MHGQPVTTTLCSQLAEILEAGAPTRQRVKQLKGIEEAVRGDGRLRADVHVHLGHVIDGIEQYWAALFHEPRARALDAVRYQAYSALQALEAALRSRA